MASSSKTKGNAAERQLCQILSHHLGGSFTRVPNSGAFIGGKNAFRAKTLSTTQTKIYKGDIICPDHLPRLVVESKSYADFPYHAIVLGEPAALLDGWIKQTLETIEPGDFSIIAFKTNRKGWAVVFDIQHQASFALTAYAIYQSKDGGRSIVTGLEAFLAANRDTLLKIANP